MRPMLATPTTSVPTGDAWLHEVKWDGMRILADVHDGELTLTSRNGNDVTASYPELAGLADTYEDLLLDGEVVALDAGRPPSPRWPSGCTSRTATGPSASPPRGR